MSAARFGRALLALVGALAGVAVAELGLRAFDPYGTSYYRATLQYLQQSIALPPEAARPDGRLFENAPSRALVVRGSTFATDAAGLRAASAEDPGPTPRDPAAPDADAPLRILFLGDSVTLGWGVDHEHTWVATLERELATPDGRGVETLNAGHLQYNTVQQVDWFRAHALGLAPDVVVLTAVVNDLDDSWALYQAFMADAERVASQGRSLRERALDAFDRWLPGLKGIVQLRAESRAARVADPEQGLPVDEREAYRAGWPLAEAALDKLLADCRAFGVPLVLFDHTTPRLPGYRAWCEANDVPWFDLNFSPEEWARPIRNSLADSHANAAGNRLLADKAAAALAEAGLVEPGPVRPDPVKR